MKRRYYFQRRRENHHKALEALAYQVDCQTPGLALWRQLRRIETWFSSYSVAYCNGRIETDKFDTIKQQASNRLLKVFGKRIPDGVFINSDPRGYALKLDNEQVEIPTGHGARLGRLWDSGG